MNIYNHRCLYLYLIASLMAIVSITASSSHPDPIGLADSALSITRSKSTAELKAFVSSQIESTDPKNAYEACRMAEIMKFAGDSRALQYYEYAIAADPGEPAYELFLAQYLRNHRGPGQPLFQEAEEHYLSALSKLDQLQKIQMNSGEPAMGKRLRILRNRIERGLIALHEREGLPIFSQISDSGINRPRMFFMTSLSLRESPTDVEEVDDSRNFTSEVLFSESSLRLNRSLSRKELRDVIRSKEQFDSFSRIRFRNRRFPDIDFTYKRRDIDDAQTTNFFNPGQFNDVELDEFGVALHRTFRLPHAIDAFVKGTYSQAEREGLVEFEPQTSEEIDQFEINLSLSRFFGRDKATVDFTYVVQDIDPQMPSPPTRDRYILGGQVKYLALTALPFLSNYGNFELRGLELFAGVLHDVEQFGDVDVTKDDFFLGASIKGLGNFDLTVQPTIFTSDVEGDPSQDNSQYRTNVSIVYRVIDEETEPGIPERLLGVYPAFLHLIVPLKHDVAIDGPDRYENFRAGIGLSAKFFTKSQHPSSISMNSVSNFRSTTFLFSASYEYQWYQRLNDQINLFHIQLSMGF